MIAFQSTDERRELRPIARGWDEKEDFPPEQIAARIIGGFADQPSG